MSNRKRPKAKVRIPFTPPKPGPGQAYVLQPAISNDRLVPGIEETMRQQTHDQLLRLYSDDLVSGIWWTAFYGDEARERFLAALLTTGTPVPDEDLEKEGACSSRATPA